MQSTLHSDSANCHLSQIYKTYSKSEQKSLKTKYFITTLHPLHFLPTFYLFSKLVEIKIHHSTHADGSAIWDGEWIS
jgi:hypothetical protein